MADSTGGGGDPGGEGEKKGPAPSAGDDGVPFGSTDTAPVSDAAYESIFMDILSGAGGILTTVAGGLINPFSVTQVQDGWIVGSLEIDPFN